jgi:hypothetical protein
MAKVAAFALQEKDITCPRRTTFSLHAPIPLRWFGDFLIRFALERVAPALINVARSQFASGTCFLIPSAPLRLGHNEPGHFLGSMGIFLVFSPWGRILPHGERTLRFCHGLNSGSPARTPPPGAVAPGGCWAGRIAGSGSGFKCSAITVFPLDQEESRRTHRPR